MIALLGLTLQEAEERLKKAGVEMEIIWTKSPRNAPEGTPRVIRATQDGCLTVACFPDQVKNEDCL